MKLNRIICSAVLFCSAEIPNSNANLPLSFGALFAYQRSCQAVHSRSCQVTFNSGNQVNNALRKDFLTPSFRLLTTYHYPNMKHFGLQKEDEEFSIGRTVSPPQKQYEISGKQKDLRKTSEISWGQKHDFRDNCVKFLGTDGVT